MGLLQLNIAGGAVILVYPKPNHTPANFTILNFPVENIDRAESEVRGQRSEVRGSEVRSQRSEVRGQKSEVRSQKSEVTGQRSARVVKSRIENGESGVWS